jgi:hypothetical protein
MKTLGIRGLLCAGAVGLLLTAADAAQAATISTYTSLASWQAATGGEDWLVDFSGFAADTPFHTDPVDAGPFTLQQVGARDFRNVVDVYPFLFDEHNGTAHASMYTNFGETTVEMVFHAPAVAWGAEFDLGSLSEYLDLVFNFVGGSSTLVEVPGDGFLGITSDVGILSVVFQSRTFVEGTMGEGFGMDDVRGVTATDVPEPFTFLLLGAGLAAGAWRRGAVR